MKVLWLSGWASDLNLFLPELRAAHPGAEHRALSSVELLCGSSPISSEEQSDEPLRARGERLLVEEMRRTDVVVAWSQGAQLLLRSEGALQILGGASPPRLIFVAPALDFCRPSTGWSPAVLRGMARAVVRDSSAVLREFSLLLGTAPEGESRWLTGAQSIAPELLAEGLRLLAEPAPPAATLASLASHLTVIQGECDRIVSLAHTAETFAPPECAAPIVVPAGEHALWNPNIIAAIERAICAPS